MRLALLIAAAVVAAPCASPFAQVLRGDAQAQNVTRPGIVIGRVTAAGQPVPHALIVRAGEPADTVHSDSSGRFVAAVPYLGRTVFQVLAVGHVESGFEVTLSAWDTVRIEIPLERSTVQLDTISVTALPADLLGNRQLAVVGFADRREMMRRMASNATFLSPADIEQRHALRTSHLLTGVRALNLSYQGKAAIPYTRSSRCVPSLWVDGQQTHGILPEARGDISGMSITGGRAGTQMQGADPLGIDAIAIDNIAAIEIYPSPNSIPPQFTSLTSQCGAIVIWTK